MNIAATITPAYATIADLLRSRTGLAFGAGRGTDLEAGIDRAMARVNVPDARAYAEALGAEEHERGSLLDDLLVEVTVGETYFFREPEHFAFLRTQALPDLLRSRDAGAPLRFLSAGCATGEEPYSLAILAEEEGLESRACILAADICRSAIARARDAVYSAWSLRNTDEAFARRYFVRQGDRFQLDPRFRDRVTFEYMNLAFDCLPSFALGVWGMDIILCRNVLIYFDRPTVQKVARSLFASLAEGGWLIPGPSDPPLAEYAPFETVVTRAGVFYRRAPRIGPAVSAKASSPKEPDGPTRHEPRLSAFQPASSPSPHFTETPLDGPVACALRIRSLASASGPARAADEAVRGVALFPLSAEIHFLHAVLLIGLRLDEEAGRVLRRVLYLDRSLAVAHFVLGTLLARRGDHAGARVAYRNARDLATSAPAGKPLPFSDGESAGRLAKVAAAELALLDPSEMGTT